MATQSDDAAVHLVSLKRDAPEAYRALAALTRAGAIDHRLAELVKVVVSHRNGCGHCIETHEKLLRDDAETEERIAALPTWFESDLFDERERAAFALAEAVTAIASGIPDEVMRQAAAVFPAPELTQLVVAIIAINGWNRAWIASEAVA